MNISATQLKQQSHLLDHVKEEDIIITKREKPFAVVIDIERYRILMKEAEAGKIEQKLTALSGLGSFSLGGKDFNDLKTEMGNG
ncbi:MAG: Antitoxin [Campylobacterota bacterium]|nr:Antitoxin [Campylobacterota bacterium]